MMDESPAVAGCPGCAALEEKLRQLAERMAVMEAELAKARKNSSNSSKPPSSDIVKPPVKAKSKKKRRKRGGQKGHPKHDRPPFPADQVDFAYDYMFVRCPDCDGPVEPGSEPPRVLQQVELIEKPTQVTEHRGLSCYCRRCQKTHSAPIAADVRRAGLLGPRLTTLVAYLKSSCHASYTTIRKYLRDVVGVTISRGYLAKLIAKASDSLKAAYDELLKFIPEQERINVDETGHKDSGQRMWTWCFRAKLFTLFKIAPSRGSDVLMDVLGAEFDGVLGCD